MKSHFHQGLNHNFFKCFCTNICSTKRRLDLSRNIVYKKIKRPLEDIDIPALVLFLKKHQEIICVNLASNNISNSGFINLLDHLRLYKNIRDLDLQNNNIMENGIQYLLEVAEDIEIKSLNLKSNKFGVKAAQEVALFLLKNKHILHLNVSEVNQTASSLIYFMMVLSSEQEDSNVTLKSLDISRPNPGCMYYFDSVHFANIIGHMLKYNISLSALHLQKYNFSCHDIESMMSNAKYNNTLHLLDLSCNNIGDHGLNHLGNWLTKRPALKILILNRNIITDHGARELSIALPFSRLLSLDISYNKITDEGMINVLNTLKKSPCIRQLKIFGNCIGHPSAKIIKRMLESQVLNQENIDVKPYRIDHKWYFARYQDDRCKKEHYDIPYVLFSQVPTISIKEIRPKKTYYKYIHLKSSEMKLQHSTMTITLGKDCKCCYCLKCKGNTLRYDSLHGDIQPNACSCCKCKDSESSEWYVDKSIRDTVISPPDPMKNIMYIMKRVNSETQENILKWININENTLKEDLKTAELNVTEESSSEDIVSCSCSWIQLSVPTLKKHLEEVSSKDLLIIPKNNFIWNARNIHRSIKTEIFQSQYCDTL
ncbi:uncharacterized protein LOC143178245 [Calliopsis andreniformis]|uniref:uncharacterized protein LOC143178245 n=1 Tax=Calliopsis andreniformis TaxID=337506 RepID=UPI003FCC37C7